MTVDRDIRRAEARVARRARSEARRLAWTLASSAALLLPLAAAVAEEGFRPAETLLPQGHRAEIGRTLAQPVAQPVRGAAVPSSCRTSCDAFTLRQPVLLLEWENEPASTGPASLTRAAAAQLRLDVSGTSAGFAEGSYGTIRLSELPEAEAGADVVLDPPSPMPVAAGEVLLHRVEANRIVERAPTLPVFDSPDTMNRLLPELPQDARDAVEADLRTGAVGQVRLLGRTSAPVRGVSQQRVTMVGLQPGGTYRLRLVDERGGTARGVVEQICRIPVCPADSMGPE